MRSAKVPAILLVVLAISVLLAVPATASGADAAEEDVGLVVFDSDLRVDAGSSKSFRIVVVNYLNYFENNINNSRMVSVGFVTSSDLDVSVDDKDENFVLNGQEHRSIAVTIAADKYATAKTYEISIILKVTSLDGGATITTDPVEVKIVVLSPLSSGDAYNKILGIFKNPFPEPLNSTFASAVITFLLWMIIGVLAMMVIMPILFRIFARDHKEEGKQIKKGLRTAIMLAVSLFAFDSSMRVYGTPEEIIGPAEVWFNVFYIALGAVVVWKIYLVFVQHVISKMSTNKRIEQRDMDVEPLLRLFGKLVLWVMAVAMIMSAWGFDLTYIITSAGIISLGITLGAQNVLSQFFSGMVLLLTRPFKSGDLVKIGGGNTIYKVYSVNIMNTVFENWDNEETVIMPNNAVSSSTIVNLTGDGLIYKITVFMNIAYDDDIDLAKDIMKKAAMDHPSVITDGSVDAPSTRVTAFLDSSIEVRLTCYVYDFNDNGRIGGDLRESIFKKFKEQGISVPFPQRDVRVKVVREDDAKKDAED